MLEGITQKANDAIASSMEMLNGAMRKISLVSNQQSDELQYPPKPFCYPNESSLWPQECTTAPEGWMDYTLRKGYENSAYLGQQATQMSQQFSSTVSSYAQSMQSYASQTVHDEDNQTYALWGTAILGVGLAGFTLYRLSNIEKDVNLLGAQKDLTNLQEKLKQEQGGAPTTPGIKDPNDTSDLYSPLQQAELAQQTPTLQAAIKLPPPKDEEENSDKEEKEQQGLNKSTNSQDDEEFKETELTASQEKQEKESLRSTTDAPVPPLVLSRDGKDAAGQRSPSTSPRQTPDAVQTTSPKGSPRKP